MYLKLRLNPYRNLGCIGVYGRSWALDVSTSPYLGMHMRWGSWQRRFDIGAWFKRMSQGDVRADYRAWIATPDAEPNLDAPRVGSRPERRRALMAARKASKRADHRRYV